MEHEAILRILKHKGFGDRWIQWITKILKSGTSSVLSADLLQSIINKAKTQGFLRLPVNLNYTSDFPIIQYADDTLLVMEACA